MKTLAGGPKPPDWVNATTGRRASTSSAVAAWVRSISSRVTTLTGWPTWVAGVGSRVAVTTMGSALSSANAGVLGFAQNQNFDAFQQHARSEEHTSELQSLMRISYAVFCLKKKNKIQQYSHLKHTTQNIHRITIKDNQD